MTFTLGGSQGELLSLYFLWLEKHTGTHTHHTSLLKQLNSTQNAYLTSIFYVKANIYSCSANWIKIEVLQRTTWRHSDSQTIVTAMGFFNVILGKSETHTP